MARWSCDDDEDDEANDDDSWFSLTECNTSRHEEEEDHAGFARWWNGLLDNGNDTSTVAPVISSVDTTIIRPMCFIMETGRVLCNDWNYE
jgi:hypothetical protein